METPIHTFVPMLRLACKVTKAETAAEWGPGKSTEVLLETPTIKRVLSIEHTLKWYEVYLKQFKDVRLELLHIPFGNEDHVEDNIGYVTVPLQHHIRHGETYDVMVVDARSRVDCMSIAYQCLAPGGVCLVHDNHRKVYKCGYDLFPYGFSCKRTETTWLTRSQETDRQMRLGWGLNIPS